MNTNGKTRIYSVRESPDSIRLIEATNSSQALRYCARQRYHVEVASAREVANHMARGVKVEQANGEEASA